MIAQPANAEGDAQLSRDLRVRELVIDGGPHAQILVDELGMLATANQAARRIFDILAGDIGRPLKELGIWSSPIALRSAIERVSRERKPFSVPAVEFTSGEGAGKVFDVHVLPLLDDDASMLGTSIAFVDVTPVARLRGELDRAKQDVETAYEELQSSNEELETTNEELQSTVEELETTNEELQSSNEELETMNEELESTNAELENINTDLHLRTNEVGRLNTLLLAITGNIEVGAAVLDGSMKVQVWNERAADLWGLRSEEVLGRTFFSLDIGLPAEQLRAMIDSVERGGRPHQEVAVESVTRRGKTIQCRVMAHTLSDGNRLGGVVLLMEELKPERAEQVGD
jgi:two-component system CheB/CheR fusion protein